MAKKPVKFSAYLITALLIILSMGGNTNIVKGEGEGFTAYLPAIFNRDASPPPLSVGYAEFSGNFNPFFYTLDYDGDVVAMTQINLLTMDRTGGIVENAIEGETRDYNGTPYLYKGPANTSLVYNETADTTTYTAHLRDDLLFSDGTPVTADDLIFTYYTVLDPSYEGQNILSSYPIVGLEEYQTQTTAEIFEKYETMYANIYNAGHEHMWNAGDSWTQEQQNDVWSRLEAGVLTETEKIVDFVNTNYLESHAEGQTGYTSTEIEGNEGLEIMFGMVMWGFGEIECQDAGFDPNVNPLTSCVDKDLITYGQGLSFDLETSFPTYEDYKNEVLASYNWDIQAAFPYESPDGTDVYYTAKNAFILFWGQLETGDEGIPNISGIVKLDDYTVEITLHGFSAPAVYDVLGINIMPMHYYGDPAKYDYENNMFGFDFGDLSTQYSRTDSPLGAGPYQFVKYENNIVHFVANPNYYKGKPKINEIQFITMYPSERVSAINNGTLDLAEITYNSESFQEIKTYNSNGELTGDVITTSLVDNLGYGYIGINAGTVNVYNDSDSESSKNLRKGIATIMAVHRYAAIENYYGDGAQVIEYPITSTSWAAPQPADPGYQLAYSVDVNGDPIYTPDMTIEQKIAAAEEAALGFFEAAGYIVESGVITAAPTGAKLSYEAIVPGGGLGEHPAFGVATSTQESLAKLGMDLVINDPFDTNVLWDALGEGTQELWAAAWGASIDPDMYQVYHSSNIVGEGGSNSNHYHIQDPLLDQLIMDARMSTDQAYRKTIYKQCLDIIMDWAVELPTYQRQNATIFSTQRINISTLTPDITTFWDWTNDIELLEMNN